MEPADGVSDCGHATDGHGSNRAGPAWSYFVLDAGRQDALS